MSSLLLKYLHITNEENDALPLGDTKRACSIIAIPPLNEVRFDGLNIIEVFNEDKIVFKTQITGNAYLMTESGKTINTFTPSIVDRTNIQELMEKSGIEQSKILNTDGCYLNPKSKSAIQSEYFDGIYFHFDQIRFHHLGYAYSLGDKITLHSQSDFSIELDAREAMQVWLSTGLKSIIDPVSKISYTVSSITSPSALWLGEMKKRATGVRVTGTGRYFELNDERRLLKIDVENGAFEYPGVDYLYGNVKIITDAVDKIFSVYEFNNAIEDGAITADLEYYNTGHGLTKIHFLIFQVNKKVYDETKTLREGNTLSTDVQNTNDNTSDISPIPLTLGTAKIFPMYKANKWVVATADATYITDSFSIGTDEYNYTTKDIRDDFKGRLCLVGNLTEWQANRNLGLLYSLDTQIVLEGATKCSCSSLEILTETDVGIIKGDIIDGRNTQGPFQTRAISPSDFRRLYNAPLIDLPDVYAYTYLNPEYKRVVSLIDYNSKSNGRLFGRLSV